MVFPSSHYSVPLINPSPQIVVQTDGVPVVFTQLYPASTVQDDEHPSPESVFPSSHYSPGYTIPFPQTADGKIH